MSAVAPAVKSVSDSPAKNAVTDPTNQTILQDDVDRKLKFYAVIQAFRAGRLPDNKQIDETLEYVKKTSPIDIAKLSPDGKRLIDDARAIIETARLIVQEKNHDELFQNFVAHTSGIDVKDKVRQPSVDTPVSADQAKKDGDVAVKHLRTLLQLLLTNSESRKLLSDLTLISRDLFAVGAAKGAEKLRPTEAQLAAVDDAAPRSEWKDSDKGLKDTVKTLGQELKDTHVEANTNGATTTAAPVTTAAPITTTSNTMPTAVAQPQATPATDGVAAPPAKKSSFMARITGRASTDKAEKDKVVNKEQVDQTAAVSKEKANKAKAASKEQYDKAKSFLTEEYFPAERRDQFIWRFKKLIVECQSHPKYAEALEWFINTLDVYFGHARSTAAAGGNQSKAIFENDPTLQRSVNELRTLLERFANGASMTPIFNATDRIWEDAQHDEALKGWWSKLSAFARKSLLEPGFIISPQFDNQWNALRDEGSQLFNGRYKDHKDHLFDAISAFFKSFADDPLNKRFGEDWTRLTKHLLFGEDGKSLSYKPQLWKDVRSVILPQLVQQVGYIPIPRIEYSDDKLDLVIENLTLQGRNLFPNVFEMVFNNHFKFSPYANIKDVQNHTISFTLSQIQADMRDVAFYFRRKAGFGKVKDSGLADVFLGGKGITVFVKVHSQGMDARSSEMGGRIFKVKSVKVKVDTLKFAIRDSHHNLLYKVVRPLATGLIKKQIAKALEDAIRTGLEALDDQLVEIRGKMDHDPNDKEFSRMGVLKDHYSSKKSEASSRASTIATKRQSRFNMVPKRESLILPDVGYEKGWIKRQAEREELVGQGEGWKSSAFTIVPNGSLPIPMKA